jgi:MYXO-CTERM domain-containing protein
VTRRVLIPFAAVAVTLSAASVAGAQGASAQTVPVPVTSTVERDVTVNSVDNQQVDNDDDDESDKTGLWGLLGLLGLAGLAGLKRRNEPTGAGYNQPVTGTAPRRADGATGSGTTH